MNVRYNISTGDGNLVTSYKKNKLGLNSKGFSLYEGNPFESSFIYVKAGEELKKGDLVFIDLITFEANKELNLGTLKAIVIRNVKEGFYTWVLLEGVATIAKEGEKGNIAYYNEETKQITNEVSNYELRAYYLDSNSIIQY